METNYSDKVTAFDTLFTTNHIQILKILLPLLDRDSQKRLAVYIKLLELQYTLDFFQRNPYAELPAYCHYSDMESGSTDRAMEICNEILPLCSPGEKEKLHNFINLYQNIENMQEMMQMMEMLKELAPEMSQDPDGGSNGTPFGMDLAQTMEMLQGMFS